MKKAAKKEDTPTTKAPTTPIHSRAMLTRQARTPKTPTAEDKRLEREDRKAQDALLRKKTTPRKGKKDEHEAKEDHDHEAQDVHEEKAANGEKHQEEKHVTFQAEKHVSFQDEHAVGGLETVIEPMDTTEEDHQDLKDQQPKDHHHQHQDLNQLPVETETTDLEDTKEKEDLQESVKKIEHKVVEVKDTAHPTAKEVKHKEKEDLQEPVKKIEHKVVEVKPTAKEEEVKHESTSAAPIVAHDAEPDTEATRREKVIMARYNQQWVEENTRRARATEQEQQRRNGATRRIESEFERAMQEEYRLRSGAETSQKPRRSTGGLVLPLYTAPAIKEEREDEDVDADVDAGVDAGVDEDVGEDEYARTVLLADKLSEDLKKSEEAVLKKTKEVEEKDKLIRQLQQRLEENAGRDKELGVVLTQLEDQRKRNELAEGRNEADAELRKLNEEIERLRAKLASKDAENRDASALEADFGQREELVNYVNAALEAEMDAVEEKKKQLKAVEERLTKEKRELETSVRERVNKIQEQEALIAAKNRDFADRVAKGVRDGVRAEVKKIKENSRKKRATESSKQSASSSSAIPSQAPAVPRMTPFTGVPASALTTSQTSSTFSAPMTTPPPPHPLISPPIPSIPSISSPPPLPPLPSLPPLIDDEATVVMADELGDLQNQEKEQINPEDAVSRVDVQARKRKRSDEDDIDEDKIGNDGGGAGPVDNDDDDFINTPIPNRNYGAERTNTHNPFSYYDAARTNSHNPYLKDEDETVPKEPARSIFRPLVRNFRPIVKNVIMGGVLLAVYGSVMRASQYV